MPPEAGASLRRRRSRASPDPWRRHPAEAARRPAPPPRRWRRRRRRRRRRARTAAPRTHHGPGADRRRQGRACARSPRRERETHSEAVTGGVRVEVASEQARALAHSLQSVAIRIAALALERPTVVFDEELDFTGRETQVDVDASRDR